MKIIFFPLITKTDQILPNRKTILVKTKTWSSNETVKNVYNTVENIKQVVKELMPEEEKLIENISFEVKDYYWKLKKIVIKNFKSIENLDIDISNNHIISIRGNNGSGKSSFIDAVKRAFDFKYDISQNTSFFGGESDNAYIEIKFEYNNKECTLIRESRKVTFYEDKEKIVLSNKTELVEYIEKKL